ncbi:MAG: hypothetical protein ABIQ10_11095 [Gemmatimonadaceae bacterium]
MNGSPEMGIPGVSSQGRSRGKWFSRETGPSPSENGGKARAAWWGLALHYFEFALRVAALYSACRWYVTVKRTGSWWLTYL